jgi:hypothetical protein
MPHVDPTDMRTIILGLKKRFACKPPTARQELLIKLKTFVTVWCMQNLIPLDPSIDLSVDNWLEGTGYSRGRINQLKKIWADCGGVLQEKHFKCKGFIKDESYPEFKHARWINARSDEFKCATGPTFKQIEKSVFQSAWFIKKIPVKDRAHYIYNRVYRTGSRYICTDYTAYEAHFTLELMEACEFVLYDYMTRFLPNRELFSFYIHHVLGGRNRVDSKLVSVEIDATRMTGEMCTSLGNGFSNLMFMLFASSMSGATNVIGVIEGDDGLFVMDGPVPTSKFFEEMGLTIKMLVVDDLARASFCGLIFDPTDKIIITNPLKVLAQTGFSTQQYVFSKSKILRGLLKAKAFSLAYQYPGCPIIASFARYLLRQLADDYVYFRKGNSDYTDLLQKEAFSFWLTHSEVLSVVTGMNTRILMEKEFGVSVEAQIELENYFDNLNVITILAHPTLLSLMPLLWQECGKYYMTTAPLEPYLIRHWFD